MKIKTGKFGEIQFDESSVINFSEGIPGFPENKRYVLISAESGSPFQWMQSLNNADLAFLVINPYIFKPDYKVILDRNIKKELDIKTRDDYILLVTVVVQDDPKESTANLLGPLVINVKSKNAKQVILNSTEYNTKHKLLGNKGAVKQAR